MDIIKQYKLRNRKSDKIYRHMTLQNIMNKLHLGWNKTHDFIAGTIQNKNYHKSNKDKKRLSYWAVKEDILPKGTLIKNSNGTFRKGISMSLGYKWTKGNNYRHPKGHHFCIEKEFKEGNIAPNFKGFGIPRLNSHRRDGTYVVTTINKNKRVYNNRDKKFHNTKVRTSYARYVFGLGEIPKNYIVFHKDGDPLNNALSNLLCINRAELIKINNGRAYV